MIVWKESAEGFPGCLKSFLGRKKCGMLERVRRHKMAMFWTSRDAGSSHLLLRWGIWRHFRYTNDSMGWTCSHCGERQSCRPHQSCSIILWWAKKERAKRNKRKVSERIGKTCERDEVVINGRSDLISIRRRIVPSMRGGFKLRRAHYWPHFPFYLFEY